MFHRSAQADEVIRCYLWNKAAKGYKVNIGRFNNERSMIAIAVIFNTKGN